MEWEWRGHSEENVKDKSELESEKAGDSAGAKSEVKESAEQTAKKLIIAKMWAATPKGDSGTPAVSPGASLARVRKAGDISPQEMQEKQKRAKKKKKKTHTHTQKKKKEKNNNNKK